MLQKVFAYIEQHHMIESDDHVIAGISGGADSVCLFFVLLEYQKKKNFSLEVLHVEHGIRGSESRADADFVKRLCQQYGIVFTMEAVNIPQIAQETGESEEEAGRRIRYEIFARKAAACNGGKIAVAHHENDQAETMLMNLIRGTGLKGITGIQPVRDNIIRPMLCLNREEIENFLRQKNQSFCTDLTNQELVYTRNRLRHEVIPVLKELNPEAVSHMCQASVRFLQAEDYLRQQTLLEEKDCVQRTGNEILLRQDTFQKKHPEIQMRILHKILAEAAGAAKDIQAVHMNQLLTLFQKQNGKQVMLPYGLCGIRCYEGIKLKRMKPIDGPGTESLQTMSLAEAEEKQLIQMEILGEPLKPWEIPKKKYTKCLDYDKMEKGLQIRHRRAGDYLIIDDAGHRKKLKDYLINEKVPAEQRDKIFLLADGSHIVWVIGYRISEAAKVTEKTSRILKIQFNGGKEHE